MLLHLKESDVYFLKDMIISVNGCVEDVAHIYVKTVLMHLNSNQQMDIETETWLRLGMLIVYTMVLEICN